MSKYINLIKDRTRELLAFGNVRQQKMALQSFKSEVLHSENYEPTFFLSTGRCGTKLFTDLMKKDSKSYVVHTSRTDLIEQGRVCYEVMTNNCFEKKHNDETINELCAQIFLAARENVLHETFLHNRTYFETNNRITFFAYAINYWMPGAKFVHLVRHPGDFIRSGIRRKWYSGSSPHDHGRLKPVKGTEEYNLWHQWDNIQKIAWLWNETNSFVENFKSTIGEEKIYQFNFENLDVSTIKRLMKFVDLDIDDKSIKKSIITPINTQKKGVFPAYSKWKKEDKDKVRAICGDLAHKYGYDLS